MANQINGKEVLDIAEHIADKEMKDAIASVSDEAKREYMERIWNLPKDGIFHELMRVHAEAGAMINAAYAEIERLKATVQ